MQTNIADIGYTKLINRKDAVVVKQPQKMQQIVSEVIVNYLGCCPQIKISSFEYCRVQTQWSAPQAPTACHTGEEGLLARFHSRNFSQ